MGEKPDRKKRKGSTKEEGILKKGEITSSSTCEESSDETLKAKPDRKRKQKKEDLNTESAMDIEDLEEKSQKPKRKNRINPGDIDETELHNSVEISNLHDLVKSKKKGKKQKERDEKVELSDSDKEVEGIKKNDKISKGSRKSKPNNTEALIIEHEEISEKELLKKEKKKKKKKLKSAQIESEDKLVSDRENLPNNPEMKILKEAKRLKRKLKDMENAENELGIEIGELQTQMEEEKKQKKLDEQKSDDESEESIDQIQEGEEPKKRKKKEKKKKEKKAEKDENQSPDEEKSSKKAALMYLQTWKSKRKKWAFKKVRQVWLLQNMYNTAKVPDSDFDVLLEYLLGLQGGSRKTTIARAEQILNSEQGMAEDSVDQERVKRVLQLLT